MATAAVPGIESTEIPCPRQEQARALLCSVCGSEEVCSGGLCRRCYDIAHHSEAYFGGRKDQVLARDGRSCRTCGESTSIVHHRKPGCNEIEWLITLCAGCHAVAHRLQRLDRYLPPLLIVLWREQHPDEPFEQLQFEWE